MTELDQAELAEAVHKLTDTFTRLIDGHPAVAVGAAMGHALRETIGSRAVLASAIATLVFNTLMADRADDESEETEPTDKAHFH